jgi:hypothetical protein
MTIEEIIENVYINHAIDRGELDEVPPLNFRFQSTRRIRTKSRDWFEEYINAQYGGLLGRTMEA